MPRKKAEPKKKAPEKKPLKFYDIKNIDEMNADYNIIIGERSNGKTFSCLKKALMLKIKEKKQTAYIRRWDMDFKKKNCDTMFSGVLDNVDLYSLTNGTYNTIVYYSHRWWLAYIEDGKKERMDDTPIMTAFSLTTMEHDKSTSFEDIKLIIFDEFISRSGYLPDEFALFQNVLSTLIRHREDVKIYMLGNTVNKYCPYFNEMGLKHVKDMKQGKIDLYTLGELRIAVEYCMGIQGGKPSDKYFCFDNAQARMITGGEWELSIYPHKPMDFKPKDIVFTFFVVFDEEMLQCEVVSVNGVNFIFCHMKTTELKRPNDDLIYTTEYDPRPNWRRGWGRSFFPMESKIFEMVKDQKIYFQSNATGEIFRNYLLWSNSASFEK